MSVRGFPQVYDLDFKRVGVLERASNIGYTMKYNGLWTAHFTMPADDPKVDLCRPLRYVEIFDSKRIELFRIVPRERHRDSDGKFIHYELEHVLATLLDDVLFRYHHIGGVGVYTPEVLEYLLGYQTTANWKLGAVEFSRQFEYSWENENLLAAIFSVANPFDEEYRWTWVTDSYPWTLNLRKADNTVGPQIDYSRNLESVEMREDATNLCTRIYPLGQGEGVNQLSIEDVNPTGEPYIDANTQNQYGIVSRVWVDRRYESAANLYESAKSMLEKLKTPRIELSVNAADVFKVTRAPAEEFHLGRICKVRDLDIGINHASRIVELTKPDVFGEPGNIQIEITNEPEDIAGTVADLASRARINEVYAQGATHLDSHQLADNCDASNPITIRFHIPPEAVHINKVLLNYTTDSFRAYSKSASSGGGSSQTSSSGGGFSTTSSSGGGQTTSSGGGQTSSSGGGHSHTVSGQTAQSTGSHRHFFDSGAYSNSARHDTGVTHYHDLTNNSCRTRYTGSHAHSVTGTTSSSVSNHTHSVSNHTHSVSNHTHSVSVDSHSHSVSIPSHTHGLDYGIYNGPTPTAVTVKVDGNTVPDLGTSEDEVDIVPYLAKDGGGRIVRGWHDVEITPNDLGRVNAVVHIQQFIQSRGDVRL